EAVGEPLDLSGAPPGRARRAAGGGEALEEHLGEEVVGGLQRGRDQPLDRWRVHASEGRLAERPRAQIGAAGAPLDEDAARAKLAPERPGRDQLGTPGVVAAVDSRVEGEPRQRAQLAGG